MMSPVGFKKVEIGSVNWNPLVVVLLRIGQ